MKKIFFDLRSRLLTLASGYCQPFLKKTGATSLHNANHTFASRFGIVFGRKYRYAQKVICLSMCQKTAVQHVWTDFRHRATGRARDMFLSAACISVYHWDDDQASDKDISEHMDDIDFIPVLTQETVTCKNCYQRVLFDQKLPEVSYCTCTAKGSTSPSRDTHWTPFLERKDSLVWRREQGSDGLYAYKMYGRFTDVTALDFLWVQLDVNYRRQWDPSAVDLLVIDEDTQTGRDVIHWEMKWPKPFANRDYVFQRRFAFDPEKRVCVIASVSTTHPKCPPKSSAYRVGEYWSFMVVRPLKDFDEPGLEFVLTYFDNPGLSIPSAVSSWVAMTGMPDFVCKLHKAAKSVGSVEGEEPLLLRPVIDYLAARSLETLPADQVRGQASTESSNLNLDVRKESHPLSTPIFA